MWFQHVRGFALKLAQIVSDCVPVVISKVVISSMSVLVHHGVAFSWSAL